MKTALVVMLGVVVIYALVTALIMPLFELGVDQFAESWIVGTLYSSWLLFWSVVLFTGLALAVVIVVAFRVLKVRCVAFRRNG